MMTEERDLKAAGRSRRGLLYGAAGGLAALAGAGFAWWRFTPREEGDALPVDFWATRLETPVASKLTLESLRGHPLVLNFWATWCPPCIEEMPLLSSFFAQNSAKGWQVLGIAVDKLAPVQAFLQQTPVPYPVALAGMTGLDLSRNLGNTAGGLPFTVLIGADGRILSRKLGKLRPDDLERWHKLG
jgi:thiol-disulfide isomerase/thioredoxin